MYGLLLLTNARQSICAKSVQLSLLSRSLSSQSSVTHCRLPSHNISSLHTQSNYSGSMLFSRATQTSNRRFVRFNSSNEAKNEIKSNETTSTAGEPAAPKKVSKFKQIYSQYGPLFIVVHLTTVVMWIYGFFLLSKQGYDITQLLNLFRYLEIMSQETLDSIHNRINNYKTESGWITGNDIKHFATAYMVYKVIAPFRYMVSIALVRSLVNFLRAKKILKS